MELEIPNKVKLEEVDKSVQSKILKLFKKGQTLKLPQTDVVETQNSLDMIKLSELSNSILASFGFTCAVILSEIEYSDMINDPSSRNILFLFCTVSTLILILSIIWRTQNSLQWERGQALYSEFDTIISSNKLKFLCFEILINLPHPLYPLKDLEFTTYNTVYNKDVNYAYNDILTILAMCRIYHLVRLCSVFSKYRTERAYRICIINGRYSGTSWTIKCLMNDNPFRVVFVMMAAGVLVGSFCFRVFERPLKDYSNLDFSYYGNAMWCTILTMTTVGYGDYYPTSLPGRIVGLMVCVWGVAMISIMVYSFTNSLELSNFEERALSLHRKLEFKDQLKIAAANILVHAYRYKTIASKFPDDKISLSIYLGRFHRALKEFQRSRLKKKILYNLNSTEDNIERKIDYLDSLVRQYSTNYNKLKRNLEDLITE